MSQPVRSGWQSGTLRILGDVAAEFIQLMLLAHNMVKRLMLPELTRFGGSQVDFAGAERLPTAQNGR